MQTDLRGMLQTATNLKHRREKMFHENVSSQGTDHAAELKLRLGIRMFAIYAMIYAGFVFINVLAPRAMEATVLLGLNLAVVYGFGLIVVALLMAWYYNRRCSAWEDSMNPGSENDGKEA